MSGKISASPLQTAGDVRCVQFPHPGREHTMPPNGRRPWKSGRADHGRSFLLSRGTYRFDAGEPDHRGDIVYWAEWEGAADRISKLAPAPHGPRWLCRPDASADPPRFEPGTPPQNTDPFVWGDAIRYTFCRQRRNGKLRRLGRGSLILFGASVGHRFALDLVFVVAGRIDHRKPEDLEGLTDEAHMRATIGPMYGWGAGERPYRLYVGATPFERANGMYSFVPCRPAGGTDVGFPRPALELNGLINLNLRMQARMLDVPEEGIPDVWQAVVDAVRAEGLALATRLQLERLRRRVPRSVQPTTAASSAATSCAPGLRQLLNEVDVEVPTNIDPQRLKRYRLDVMRGGTESRRGGSP